MLYYILAKPTMKTPPHLRKTNNFNKTPIYTAVSILKYESINLL